MKEKYAAVAIANGTPADMNEDLCKALPFMLQELQGNHVKPTRIEVSIRPTSIGIALVGAVGTAPIKEQLLLGLCKDYLAKNISADELVDHSEVLGY